MHALAFLLGSRALDTARDSKGSWQRRDEIHLPIASTPEKAAAWRRWRHAGAVTAATRHPEVVLGRPAANANPG
jgi:hypothetical protein